MEEFPKIKRMGERAILLEFEPKISEESLAKVLGMKKYLQEKLVKQKVEVQSTYSSLLISYTCAIEDAYREVLSLKEEFSAANIQFNIDSRLFHVPVCYDEIFALDMDEISRAKALQKEDIIHLHSSTIYTVYFTGFLPGFLYLGGLPGALSFSRKEHPHQKVEKGAVGIGEKQTGIYPQESPGGWNIIGNSPVPLFDPTADIPCEIKGGDRIKFYPVDFEEHERISKQVEKGSFRFKVDENDG